MMGHPAEDQFASDCLTLWGRGKGFGGPKGYATESAFVLKARGLSIEWNSDIDELVGAVVTYCLDEEQRFIVRTYFQPQAHPKRNGERVQKNMTLTEAILAAKYKKISRDKINQAVDRAIGKVTMALGYPPGVWITLTEEWKGERINKKVCNL